MKIAKFLFAFCLVVGSFSKTNAQGNISLDSVGGEYAPDSLLVNSQIDFYISFQNQSASSFVTEFIHKFRISSDKGAVWNNAGGFFENDITTFYDLTTIDDVTTTGSLTDTITFLGNAFQPPATGAPPGYENVAFRITIGPFGSADHGKAVCLDSSLAVPGESWLWVYDQQQNITPSWDGPHCFTVIDPNQLNTPPVITPLGSFTANETETVTFAIMATDVDQDFINISMTNSDLPASAVFDPLPNISGVANLTWPTGYDDAGTYFAEFTATDGLGFDIDSAFIMVNNTNRPPVLNPIGNKTYTEGVYQEFDVWGADPDGDNFAVTSSTLPTGATFMSTSGGMTFAWQPGFDQAGTYNVTFYITDDSGAVDSEVVQIDVNDFNTAPVLDPVLDTTIDENSTLSVTLNATDAEGDSLEFFIYSISGQRFPEVADFSYVDNGDNTATFTYTPNFDAASDPNDYWVGFAVRDPGNLQDEDTVVIKVNNVNRPPLITPLVDQTISETDTLNLFVTTSDADGDPISLQPDPASTLPLDAIFTDSGNGNGSIFWVTDYDDAGVYQAIIRADDPNDGVDFDTVQITVVNQNRAPVISPVNDTTIDENQTIVILVTATDDDGDNLNMDYIDVDGITGEIFLDNGNNTGTFTWTTTFDDAGVYDIIFSADDGNDSFDADTVHITVNNVNRPPVLNAIGPQIFNENEFNSFLVSGFDPDGGDVSISVQNLPIGSSFDSVAQGWEFTWTPDFDQSGLYNVTFTVTDDSGATDDEVVSIQVNNTNRPPVMAAISNQNIDEGDSAVLVISAADPDTDDSLYFELGTSESGPPPNVNYVDNGDGTMTATFTPSFDDSGSYDIEIFVYDTAGASSSDVLIVTYNHVNRSPVMNFIASPQFFNENQYGEFNVSGFDPDGDGYVFSFDSIPNGASFEGNNGSRLFSWTPTYDQEGNYDVTFFITDDSGAYDSQVVTLTVLDIPCTDLAVESFTLSGPQQISDSRQIEHRLNVTLNNLGPLSLDSQFTLRFYYSDTINPFEPGITYELGTQLVNSIGIGQLDINMTDSVYMNPDAGNGPAYLIVFIDDANYTDCDPQNNLAVIPFELVDNIPAVLDSIGDQQVNEGETLGILLTATDVDGDFLEFSYLWQAVVFPNNLSFTDSGNGVAYFELTPDFDDAGVYDITFEVQDYVGFKFGGGSFDFETITITVNDVNRPPSIDTLLPDTIYVTENELLEFSISSSDPDGECLSLDWFTPDLPAEADFFETGECGSSGLFTWQTDFDDAETYSAFFVVTDFNSADTALVTIVVEPNLCADLVVNNFELIDNEIRISRFAPLKPRLKATVENIGETTTGGQSTVAFYISTDSVFSIQTDQILSNGRIVIGDVSNGNLLDVTILDNMQLTSFPDGPAYLLMVTDELGTISECNEQNNVGWIPVEVVGNIPPIAVPNPDTTIDETQSLTMTIIGIDPDSDGIFINEEQIPETATLTDNFDGTAIFEWTPGYFDAGDYEVIVRTFDFTEASVTDSFIVTVNNVNRPPQFEENAPDVIVNEGEDVDFYVFAFDPDFERVFYSAESPTIDNEEYTFDDGGKGSGRFEWTPGFDDAGAHTFYLYAEDTLGGQDVDTIVIKVNNINVPPVFDPINFVSVNENELVNLNITASDFDGTIPALTVDMPLPLGADFTDNGNGTAAFNWTPDCNQSIVEGSYFFRCYATDDSGAVDTGFIEIAVNEACDEVLTVNKASCVQCVPPQTYADILVDDNGFFIQFNNQVIPSTIDSNINFNSRRGSSFDYFYNEKLKQIEAYPLSGRFAAADTILVSLNQNILDLNEQPLDSSYNLVYRTGGIVYPGDCNNDGVVNEIDVLSIGLFYNNSGPQRDVDIYDANPFDFFAQPVHFEEGLEVWSPVNGVYADVDGSGIVDANDICGVARNFGETVNDEQFQAAGTQGKITTLKEYGTSVLQAMYDALIECREDKAPELVEMIERALRESSPLLPTEVTLYQNYPNPFNPSTVIEFYLPEAQHVTLEIYNMLGQKVVTLVDGSTEAGFKEIIWSGMDNSGAQVATGIYFYKLITEDKVETKRMLLVK